MFYTIFTCGTNLVNSCLCLEANRSVNNIQQGNQRWQIPRPATCQYLATFTPLKSKILIFYHDVISLLARVYIVLIDTATQELAMKNI